MSTQILPTSGPCGMMIRARIYQAAPVCQIWAAFPQSIISLKPNLLLRRTYAVASTPYAVRWFSFILLHRHPRHRAVSERTASLQCPRACYWCNPRYHGQIRRSGSLEKHYSRNGGKYISNHYLKLQLGDNN